MSKGTVKYFNDDRGWGIIGSTDSEQDVYVHHTAIDMDGFRTLKQGQHVLFDVILTDNGPHARNVRLSG
jgi:CspA family cold shock protein